MDSSKLMAAYSSGMMLNKKLTDLLDKPFSDSLDVELKANVGASLEQLNQLKPMNIMLALSMTYLIKDNEAIIKKYTGKPLDVFFAEQGKLTSKSITALETIEEQMDILFNKTSIEEQLNQLKSFIRTKNESIKSGNELMNSWFAHDLNKMYTISEDAMKLYGSEDDLIKNRNNNWIKKLPGIITKQSTFIAVGALHLPGSNGIVKQLQKLGYILTPIKL
ncbi:MAG: TraB/GumN family protein [Bacteroidetes bacterium]|nr:TraB/GumN family protein [Bacteroidota bacterium]